MRVLLSAVAALALAVPAASQAQDSGYPADDGSYEVLDQVNPNDDADYDYDDRDYDRDLGRDMRDPQMQARVGDGIATIVDVLFELPIGGLLNAAEGMDPRASKRHARYDPRMTVGDIASRDNPNLRGHMRRTARQMPRMMGAMAEAMAQMAPVFERAMEQVEQDWDRARRRY